MVDAQGPQTDIKQELEHYPPQMPENPEALESEKRRIVGVNMIVIAVVVVIFIVAVLVVAL
jgi:hypothetical protein